MNILTNEQLTGHLTELSNRVQGQADRLEAFMPEIRDKVLQGEATSSGMADQLKELINPMLQADLINRSKTLEDKTDLLSGMIATINTNLSEHGKILEDMKNKFE